MFRNTWIVYDSIYRSSCVFVKNCFTKLLGLMCFKLFKPVQVFKATFQLPLHVSLFLWYIVLLIYSPFFFSCPEMISRYPLQDREDYPLPPPDHIGAFCMPMGATIECWADTREHPLPIFSTFVLTEEKGGRVGIITQGLKLVKLSLNRLPTIQLGTHTHTY